MSGLKFTMCGVTWFLLDSLSGLKKIIFRPDFTHFSGVSIVEFQRIHAGWYNFKCITFYIDQVF